MAIVLYYGSGSPFAWRVQLALEHKALAYERKVLSFSAGDTRKPEFVALNPRHRVPVIVDGDFVLLRVECDHGVPGRCLPCDRFAALPGRCAHARARAPAHHGSRQLFRRGGRSADTQAFAKKPEERDAKEIAASRAAVVDEIAISPRRCAAISCRAVVGRRFRFLPVHQLSAALRDQASRSRCRRHADARASGVEERIERCRSSTKRFRRTGRRKDATMKLTTTAFADGGVIPAEFAFCAIDPAAHVSSRAIAIPISHGADCRPGRNRSRCSATIPTCRRAATTSTRKAASSPRRSARRLLPLGADRPAGGDAARSSAVEFSDGVRRAESPVPRRLVARVRRSTTTADGSPATRKWQATISVMTDRARRGTTSCRTGTSSRCMALDVARLGVGGVFKGQRCA